jgi:membrane fusion protein, multidrug efflux system
MSAPEKRYGFAAVVGGVLVVAALAVGAKIFFDGDKSAGAPAGPPAQALAKPAGPGGPPGGGRGEAPQVQAAAVANRSFSDAVQAIGTAQARESIVVTSKVTDVIRAIRFDSGDRVAKGQTLVELANVEQMADLNEARASLEVEKREFERFKSLGESGFAPKARVEEAQAAFERAEARVQALQARIADRTIRAPFAGVMGLRTASPGQLARPGDPIATLDDVSSIKLDFDVPEPRLANLKTGVAISATSAASPGRAFTGVIDSIDSRINAASRTVRVRALLPNADRALKPGMLMSVEIQSNPREALAVAEMAVLEQADGAYVFRVLEKDGKTVVERTKITLGARSAGFVEVRDGLNVGDRIVTEGVQRVRPGQPVKIAPPPAEAKPSQTAQPAPPALIKTATALAVDPRPVRPKPPAPKPPAAVPGVTVPEQPARAGEPAKPEPPAAPAAQTAPPSPAPAVEPVRT